MSETINSIALIIIVTGQIVTYFWFITLGLIALCLFILNIQKPTSQTLSNKLLQFVPFVLTLTIVIYGGVFYADNSFTRFYPWANNLIYIFLLLQLSISVTAILRTKGQRGFILTLSILQFWFSLTSGFVSLMSINDAWL